MIALWVQGTVRHHAVSALMTVHACMHGALHANICQEMDDVEELVVYAATVCVWGKGEIEEGGELLFLAGFLL